MSEGVADITIGGESIGARMVSWDLSTGRDHSAMALAHRLPSGKIEVSGTVTATFAGPDLHAWLRRSANAHENSMLRLIRPVMPKRRWQRLRGMVKARRAKL